LDVSLAPAADAVLQILVLLARQAEPVPAALIGSSLELPRSTTYRLLGALEAQGLVSYLPEERRYGLGVVAFELGSSYSRQMPLRRIAQPVLSRLVATARQNAHLAVLHGTDVYYVIEERAPGRAPLVTDVGVRLPATLTASGLAILAALPTSQLRAVHPTGSTLVQRDGRGPATIAELRQLLATVRKRGYAVEDGLVTAGLSSVGVPVRDHTGHPVAGVSVTYQAEHVDAGGRARLVSAVGRAAETLTRRLGG
jgi:DNA-binding IclR family transcriptional regulator